MLTLESILSADMDADIDFDLTYETLRGDTKLEADDHTIPMVQGQHGLHLPNREKIRGLHFLAAKFPADLVSVVFHKDLPALRSLGSAFHGGPYAHVSLKSVDMDVIEGRRLEYLADAFMNTSIETFTAERLVGHQVENANLMFYECPKLRSVYMPAFNPTGTCSFSSMFKYCESLKSVDLSAFEASRASNLAYMFFGCEGLESISLPKLTSARHLSTEYMFGGCKSCKSIELPSSLRPTR